MLTYRDAQRGPARASSRAPPRCCELARVFSGRRLNRTLVLVSTSGGSAGAAGAEDFARHAGRAGRRARARGHGGHDAAQADRRAVARQRRRGAAPAPADRGRGPAPRRAAGAGAARAPGQFARLAFPFTFGEQGVLAEAGLPAVLLQGSASERGPPGGGHRPRRLPRLRPFGAARNHGARRGPGRGRRARLLRGHPQARAPGLGGAARRRDAAGPGAGGGGGRSRPRAPPARAGGPRDRVDARGRTALPAGGRLRLAVAALGGLSAGPSAASPASVPAGGAAGRIRVGVAVVAFLGFVGAPAGAAARARERRPRRARDLRRVRGRVLRRRGPRLARQPVRGGRPAAGRAPVVRVGGLGRAHAALGRRRGPRRRAPAAARWSSSTT